GQHDNELRTNHIECMYLGRSPQRKLPHSLRKRFTGNLPHVAHDSHVYRNLGKLDDLKIDCTKGLHIQDTGQAYLTQRIRFEGLKEDFQCGCRHNEFLSPSLTIKNTVLPAMFSVISCAT